MCHLSLTPRTYWEVISDRQRTGPRESHPSEDLSELPPLRDPATRWFPNVMDYSDLKQGCGWTGVPLCPFPVMAAPGAARFLQAAVTRSYRTGLYARPIMIPFTAPAPGRGTCPVPGGPVGRRPCGAVPQLSVPPAWPSCRCCPPVSGWSTGRSRAAIPSG